MRVRITVGEVDLRVDGVDLTKRDVLHLLKRASLIAAGLSIAAAMTHEEAERAPIGFSATVERLPEDIPKEDSSWYFDE